MIQKELQPIYSAMVKTTYVPIIRRVIAILLIHDMDRMQAQTHTTDEQFFDLISSYDGKKSLLMCLNSIEKRRSDIIQEILVQYNINSAKTMQDFYHEHFEHHFKKQIDFIKKLVASGRFNILDKIARTQPE